jgi:hypothetical protein
MHSIVDEPLRFVATCDHRMNFIENEDDENDHAADDSASDVIDSSVVRDRTRIEKDSIAGRKRVVVVICHGRETIIVADIAIIIIIDPFRCISITHYYFGFLLLEREEKKQREKVQKKRKTREGGKKKKKTNLFVQ